MCPTVSGGQVERGKIFSAPPTWTDEKEAAGGIEPPYEASQAPASRPLTRVFASAFVASSDDQAEASTQKSPSRSSPSQSASSYRQRRLRETGRAGRSESWEVADGTGIRSAPQRTCRRLHMPTVPQCSRSRSINSSHVSVTARNRHPDSPNKASANVYFQARRVVLMVDGRQTLRRWRDPDCDGGPGETYPSLLRPREHLQS